MKNFFEKSAQSLVIGYHAVRTGWNQHEFAELADHLSTLLDAGLPVMEGIEHMSRRRNRRLTQKILVHTMKCLHAGKPISLAWEPYITPIFMSMLLSGEKSGQLESVLKKYADQRRELHMWKSQILRLLSYPILLSVMTTTLLIYVATVVLPMFRDMYAQLGFRGSVETNEIFHVLRELPIELLVPICIFIAVCLFMIFVSKRFKQVRFALFRWVPGMRFARLLRTRTFSIHMSLLLSAGVPLVHALGVIQTSRKPRWLARTAAVSLQQVLLGQPPNHVLSDGMDEVLAIFLHTAEKTGDLAGAFEHTETYATKRLEKSMQRFARVLEPTLLMIMGLVVGLTMYAVFIPMYDFINVMLSPNHG